MTTTTATATEMTVATAQARHDNALRTGDRWAIVATRNDLTGAHLHADLMAPAADTTLTTTYPNNTTRITAGTHDLHIALTPSGGLIIGVATADDALVFLDASALDGLTVTAAGEPVIVHGKSPA